MKTNKMNIDLIREVNLENYAKKSKQLEQNLKYAEREIKTYDKFKDVI